MKTENRHGIETVLCVTSLKKKNVWKACKKGESNEYIKAKCIIRWGVLATKRKAEDERLSISIGYTNKSKSDIHLLLCKLYA